jgi:elongation factor G
MKSHETSDIRNIALVGHGHCGKTSLTEALLFTSGVVARLGSVDAGTATTDFGEDEHQRKISIRLGLAHVSVGSVKLNLVDSPGFASFLNDARVGLSVVETAVVVVDALAGVEVQTERTWGFAEELQVPARVFVLNKMDRENVSFATALKGLQDRFGRKVVAVQLPVVLGGTFRGVVDLVTRTAQLSKGDGTAAVESAAPPAEVAAAADRARQSLMEMVAESDEALMERFLEVGELTEAELASGLRRAVGSGAIYPVACTNAAKVVGVKALADLLATHAPPPTARPSRASADGKEERKCADSEHVSFQVFKTLHDPFAGRLSLLRVQSGVLRSDATYLNVRKGHEERCALLVMLSGKEQVKVTELHAGDIGCLAKLKDTLTGDTLAEKAFPIQYPDLSVPEPMLSYALTAKNQGEEDKIAAALHKIAEEDLVLRYRLDPQTKELVVSGAGDDHIDAVVGRLRDRFKVEVVLHPPRVPYRETVTRSASGSYRHKKQTGGAGQFAEVHMEVKPLPRGRGFEYDTDRVYGGSISNNFFPSIEKGIRQVLDRGPLAGYPVVDIRAEVYDGKMHAVDSKDIAFQTAGRQLMKQLIGQAHAILLEPIMRVAVAVPEDCMGDVMGDLSSRRGRVQGMEMEGKRQVIRALVPLAEMLTYMAQLKSVTGGRGDYTMELDHYDPVPAQVQEKLVGDARKHLAEEKEE